MDPDGVGGRGESVIVAASEKNANDCPMSFASPVDVLMSARAKSSVRERGCALIKSSIAAARRRSPSTAALGCEILTSAENGGDADAASTTNPRARPVVGSSVRMASKSVAVGTQCGGYLNRATSSTRTMSCARE
eukprot:Amastigsp_a175122_138.p3 type:complete len:135 gc:universal Amastigsp_a175122_138:542-946(+)